MKSSTLQPQDYLQDGTTSTLQFDDRLMSLEKLFHAPPLTAELVSAIKLINPHFNFKPDENSRLIWEADQNGACWGEYEALTSFFHLIPRPAKILEIGPGMGRSLVFFSKKLGWEDCNIHAYEGEGSKTRYTILGPRFENSFCGNLGMLNQILDYNGITNVTMFDAKEYPLASLPGPYDFIYSFYSVGFHWSLEHFLDDILILLNEEAISVFTVPNNFTPFPRLGALSYRVVKWKAVWPKNLYLKLLVLSKKPLPR